MTRTQKLFVLLSAGLFAAWSCSSYEPDTVLKDSRVTITMGENAAKPAWEAGDRVSAFAMDGTTPVSTYLFTATGSGSTAEFSCPTDIVTAQDYRFVYPNGENLRLEADGIRARIPVNQQPVEGSVDPDLYLCTGSTTSLSSGVNLSPLVAFVRFTILGGAAEDVVRATLSSAATLSGDVVFYDAESLHSQFYDIPADESNPSNYVQLDGRFSSGGTYFAAVVPGASGVNIQLTLEDVAGTTHVQEVKGVNLVPGQIADLGTVYLGNTLMGDREIFPIMTATKGKRPVVLMFVPDGFVEGSGPNSREEYVKACREGAAYLFNVEPLKSMKDYFTVYVTWKAASEAGPGTTFGTSLGLWYENYYGLTTAVRNGICEFAQGLCPEIQDGTIQPSQLGMLLLVNGRKNYGAVCEWSEANAKNEGRFVAVLDYSADYQWGSLPVGVTPSQWGGNVNGVGLEAKTDENGKTYTYTLTEADYRELGYTNYSGNLWGSLGTWKNTLLHEGIGHGLGRLQDEYWFSTTAYSGTAIPGQTRKPRQAMNISASATDYPWKNLMSLRDELIEKDPRYARIGMYQGGLAQYFSGVWKAERAGVMNDLRPYFGTWDRALIYERIMQLSGEREDFDVVNSMADLRTFLEADLANNGNYDPIRE